MNKLIALLVLFFGMSHLGTGQVLPFMKKMEKHRPVLSVVVKDSQGDPLPFANITYEKEGEIFGSMTDLDGNFSLPFAVGEYYFTTSYLGYVTDERTVMVSDDGKQKLEIILESQKIELTEVVVAATKFIGGFTDVTECYCFCGATSDTTYPIVSIGKSEMASTKNLANLYPNPTTGLFHLDLNEEVTGIRVLDWAGHQVLAQNGPSRQYRDMDIGHLPSGTYLVSFLVKGQWHTQKLILVK